MNVKNLKIFKADLYNGGNSAVGLRKKRKKPEE
jgi:hypothetical protein